VLDNMLQSVQPLSAESTVVRIVSEAGRLRDRSNADA